MTVASADRLDEAPLDLPPGFATRPPQAGVDAFETARAVAAREGAGTLIWRDDVMQVEFAVVLEPDEPLRTARRAFVAGMSALADSIGAVGPPEKPVSLEWPDVVRFDGARLAGGRLAWPDACDEDAVPDWLVFGATVAAWSPLDPGLSPDTTTLAEEGFPEACGGVLVEAFARYLLGTFDLWREEGFEAVAAAYCRRAPRGTGFGGADTAEALADGLRSRLLAPTWRDPETGGLRR